MFFNARHEVQRRLLMRWRNTASLKAETEGNTILRVEHAVVAKRLSIMVSAVKIWHLWSARGEMAQACAQFITEWPRGSAALADQVC